MRQGFLFCHAEKKRDGGVRRKGLFPFGVTPVAVTRGTLSVGLPEFSSRLTLERGGAFFLVALALRSTPSLLEVAQFLKQLGLSQPRIRHFVSSGVVDELLERPLVQGFVM